MIGSPLKAIRSAKLIPELRIDIPARISPLRRSIFIGSFLLLPWTALAADAPFSPSPDVVDYVATFRSDENVPEYRTVHHHGAWTRVEVTQGHDHATTYSNADLSLAITVDPASRETPVLAIESGWPVRGSLGWREHPSKLRQHDTVLGEPCDVWQIGDYLRSCVTADGIELRKEPDDAKAMTKVVTLERRAVAESDVLPPADIFNWVTWSSPAQDSASGTKADAVVTMEATGEPPSQRTTRTIKRRHQHWSSYERFEGEVRRTLLINNDKTELALRFDAYPDGKSKRLLIWNPGKATRERSIPVAPLKSRPEETVLGEVCTWFIVKSGPDDIRHTECDTTDGLTLKEAWDGPGGITQALTATRIERKPLSLADVSPPPSVFDPGHWGIPAR